MAVSSVEAIRTSTVRVEQAKQVEQLQQPNQDYQFRKGPEVDQGQIQKQQDIDQKQQDVNQKQQGQQKHQLQEVFKRLERVANTFDRQLHFKLHEGTKQYFVQIIDKDTGEVVNEIPPKKILDLEAQIKEMVGLLIDNKA